MGSTKKNQSEGYIQLSYLSILKAYHSFSLELMQSSSRFIQSKNDNASLKKESKFDEGLKQ